MTDLFVNKMVTIPSGEIRFRFARSGGPGGQNVNKVESSAELLFDVRQSVAFSPVQRDHLLTVLKKRIDADGVLRITVQDSRSQWKNRETALTRLADMLRRALVPRKKRVPTRIPRGAREERITQKRRRGERLKNRRALD
jgi:ribosome-associated protein